MEDKATGKKKKMHFLHVFLVEEIGKTPMLEYLFTLIKRY